MEKTILQWNIYNWITIVLMAAIGMAAVGAGSSLIRQYLPGASGNVAS